MLGPMPQRNQTALEVEGDNKPLRRVLVIDDDPDVCEVVMENTRGLGFSCFMTGGEFVIRRELSMILGRYSMMRQLRSIPARRGSLGIVVVASQAIICIHSK